MRSWIPQTLYDAKPWVFICVGTVLAIGMVVWSLSAGLWTVWRCLLCFAGAARIEEGIVRDIRIALGSVAPIVLRAVKTEASLRGNRLTPEVIAGAKDALAREIAPIDDIRSTARYRLRIAQNLLQEFLMRIAR